MLFQSKAKINPNSRIGTNIAPSWMNPIGLDHKIIVQSCLRMNLWLTMIYKRECSNIEYWCIIAQSY